jgi:hypothetical protein
MELAAHAFTGVIRIAPSSRHHHRVDEIPTGFSEPTQMVEVSP